MTIHYPFVLQPLPYRYHALQPYLTRETVCNHYEHHHHNYVNQLNQILLPYTAYHKWSLTQLLTNLQQLPAEIRTSVANNAGGMYNHNLYWNSMTPRGCGYPMTNLAHAINQHYNGFTMFQQQFQNNAMSVFGSGWTWLVTDTDGNLNIVNTVNQQVPDLLTVTPLLVLDLWEHAYYLQYRYNRKRYVENWWPLVNWNYAEAIYNSRQTGSIR